MGLDKVSAQCVGQAGCETFASVGYAEGVGACLWPCLVYGCGYCLACLQRGE